MTKALITGVGGQDGSYLSKLLLSKGYEVHGIVRRSSVDNKQRLKSVLKYKPFLLIEGDITDSSFVTDLISTNKYDEVYNLAAQSHVGTSFQEPLSTFEVDAKAPIILLEAIRRYSKGTKFYQASTSELFGSSYSVTYDNITTHYKGQVPKELIGIAYQGINTPFHPNSPYAIAKLAAHEAVRMYREAYGIHASAGILFNHESPVRGTNFVTRKITKYIGDLVRFLRSDPKLAKNGLVEGVSKLKLGNLDAYRDWGHAEDYVVAMWTMLQQDKPKDYVVATGETNSIHTFLAKAFSLSGLKHWQHLIEISDSEKRPHDVNYLRGDCSEIIKDLNWRPFYNIDRLVGAMVDHDIQNEN